MEVEVVVVAGGLSAAVGRVGRNFKQTYESRASEAEDGPQGPQEAISECRDH